MSGQVENLYKVKKKDIPKAGAVLAVRGRFVWCDFGLIE
jgi:hypothetical protein